MKRSRSEKDIPKSVSMGVEPPQQTEEEVKEALKEKLKAILREALEHMTLFEIQDIIGQVDIWSRLNFTLFEFAIVRKGMRAPCD